MPIQSFQIKVPEQVLVDLRERIERTRWPDEITDSGWEHGANLSYMKELADYWLNKFDWRKIENEINDFVKVPVGIARFPLEDAFPPRKYIERSFNIQRWTNMPAGGHFASMEKPELLAEDIRAFFRTLQVG